jgi:LuxR family maltose regulon positive regulatory protein
MFEAVPHHALNGIASAADLPKVLGIVAPVGYGKTVLMTTLFTRLTERSDSCLWYPLDYRHNTTAHVLTLVEELVYGHTERMHPTQALFRGDDPVDLRIDRLIEAAYTAPAPVTIFIDNLNHCTDDALTLLLDRLVFETPASLRLVISSSTALPFDITRAKLMGLIRQLTYRELCFNPEEVTRLLSERLCHVIGPQGIDVIARKTEGWPAAVRMVQIILDAATDPGVELERFSGSDEDVAAFLNREVLSSLPADVRDFLFSIAPLRTLSAELINEATGYEDAERYFSLLFHINAFIIPLDRNHTWYRLHALFREYLLKESRKVTSRCTREQTLVRAARWCEKEGYWRDAIEYALEANASEAASTILERSATNFVRDRGDMLQYIAWVEILRQRRIPLGWETEYWYVWALVLRRRYADARSEEVKLSRRIERSGGEAAEEASLRALNRRVDITRVCLAIFSDDLSDAHINATHWLQGTQPDDHAFDTTAAHLTQSLYYSSTFQFMEARDSAHTAQIHAFQTQSVYANGWIIGLNSLPSIFEGNYSQIQPELINALAFLRTKLDEHSGIYGTVALLAANCAVEMGQYEEGLTFLEQGLRTSRIHGVVDIIACGLDAAVKLWSNSEPNSLQKLAELREIANSYSHRAGYFLSCYLVRRLLRLGNIPDAITEASRIGIRLDAAIRVPLLISSVPRNVDAYLAAAIDLHINTGMTRNVESLIVEESRHARHEGRACRLVELALTEAGIAVQKGNLTVGNRHLTRAITVASTRSIVRPFDDHAEIIAQLVQETKPTSWGFALAQERRFFSDICRRLPLTNPETHDSLDIPNLESHLVESLTRRQKELLALLDAGLSNQQIADRINVSLTTVKGHFQKLYMKLDVSSRSAALARARALKLI